MVVHLTHQTPVEHFRSEVEGVHYHFIDAMRFGSMREGGELLEWAEVHGNFYGTPRDRIDEALQQGKDVLLEIDWQGARQIKQHCSLGDDSQELIRIAMTELNLSARAYDRILKVSRTVADLAGSNDITPEHVSEAIQYRTFDRTLWV